MELDAAEWLADLIRQAIASIEHSPGLTIEVDDDPANWVQVIPASDQEDGRLSGFVLNLPFRATTDDPLAYLRLAGLKLPPETKITAFEQGSHITLWLRPDVPLVALALLIDDFLVKVGKAPSDHEVNVQVLHGL